MAVDSSPEMQAFLQIIENITGCSTEEIIKASESETGLADLLINIRVNAQPKDFMRDACLELIRDRYKEKD